VSGPAGHSLPGVTLTGGDRGLVDAPLDDLLHAAARVRDDAFGDHVTFSPKVFVPLTMLCRDRCGY
jgi:2-iminoacetate synthase ThiH